MTTTETNILRLLFPLVIAKLAHGWTALYKPAFPKRLRCSKNDYRMYMLEYEGQYSWQLSTG
jgi:hypothetical protein